MQKYCFELTERLLKSLDKEYNVVDMGAVVEVITALEKTTITKEVLEFTRLGKYINELRRKTSNDALAKRAKDLVRRWRDMVLPSAHTTPQPTPADTAPVALNGAKPQSPALRCLKPQSPALRGLKPQSPLVKDTTPLRVLSPALSVHSERSHSPHSTPNKTTTNHRTNPDESPKLGPAIQNHVTEAVPRTHSSNKRLRKDDSDNVHSTTRTPGEPFTKRQRFNGENLNSSLNSQVPSPLSKERIPEKSTEHEVVESEVVPTGPKKRGRKKGSKSVKKQQMVEDHVKEKLASISRNPKLKTTQELLADLQARGSNSNSIVTSSQGNKKEPPSTEDVLRSNNEHVTKYLQSQNDILRGAIGDVALQTRLKSNDNDRKVSRYRDTSGGGGGGGDSVLNLKSRESPTRNSRDLTVAEILAKLPPLDLNSIVWSDQEEEQDEDDSVVKDCPPVEINPEDLEILHLQHVEGLNGNFQPKLSSLTINVENDNNEVSNVTDLTDRVATSKSDLSSNNSKKQDNTTTTTTTTLGDVTRKEDTNLQNSDNKNGSQKDREFREWHQMLARPSYDDQTLHILPYVIID